MKKLWKDPNLFAKPFLEIMIDIKYINNIVIVIDKRKPNKPFLLFFFLYNNDTHFCAGSVRICPLI